MVKVKLSLFIAKYEAMKTYGGVTIYFNTVISVLDGGEWLASRPDHFISVEGGACTRWLGGCVGLRAGLDAVENKHSQPV